jgi:hypothetical protein
MAVAVSKKVFSYILRDDRDKLPAEQTVFSITTLSGVQKAYVMPLVASIDHKSFSGGDRAVTAALENGLSGWSNFRDENGNEIKFVPGFNGGASGESIARLSMNDCIELMNAVVSGYQITADELGK